jgi:predicted PurR-regulated permease PerM
VGGVARVVAGLLLAYLGRDVLLPIAVSVALAAVINPVVDRVARATGLRRWIPAVLAVIALAAVVLGGFALVADHVARDVTLLARQDPHLISRTLAQAAGQWTATIGGVTVGPADIGRFIESSIDQILFGDALRVGRAFVSLGFSVLLTALLTGYLTLDPVGVRESLAAFVPVDARRILAARGPAIAWVLRRWLAAQLVLVALVTVVLFVILGAGLHVPYAALLAVTSGVLELIPVVGPIAAALLTGAVAWTHQGPAVAVGVLVVYAALRLVQDQLVAPAVVGRAVKVHPMIALVSVLVGLSAIGIAGALLAVPIVAAARATINEPADGADRICRVRSAVASLPRRSSALPCRGAQTHHFTRGD